jgi:tetratricopeptide (TPR) repeat protein
MPAQGDCSHCKAKEAISAAEAKIAAAASSGVEVRKADQLLRDARNGLEEGNFTDARANAEKTVALVLELEAQFAQAKEHIAEAESVVADHRSRSVDVGQADSLIQLSQSFLKTGNYEKAVAYAKKAIKTANEAQTRLTTEKAMGDRPPIPPAVALPVEPAAAPDAAGGAREAPPAAQPSSRPTVVAPKAAEPATRAPATGLATDASSQDPEYLAAEKEIRDVGAELDKLEKRGQNVAHARNLLKLAQSFLRGGSFEKATRYARKVKNVLEEKKEE